MMTPEQLAAELERRLGGPHADEHTTGAALTVAEAIRFLNYATGSYSAAALTFPSTAYRLAADLSAAASRMPQLFSQLSLWLSEQIGLGLLGTDSGDPADYAVLFAREHLREAAASARALAGNLSAVQNDLSSVNGRGPNRSERAA